MRPKEGGAKKANAVGRSKRPAYPWSPWRHCVAVSASPTIGSLATQARERSVQPVSRQQTNRPPGGPRVTRGELRAQHALVGSPELSRQCCRLPDGKRGLLIEAFSAVGDVHARESAGSLRFQIEASH